MPRTRKDEAPILLDEPEIEGRYAGLGDHTVSFLDPAMGRLLRRTVTGGRCRYDPEPARPVRWVLDERDRQ